MLWNFRCTHTPITTIPEIPPNLLTLEVSHNRINSLPSFTNSVVALIDLRNNNLRDIPRQLANNIGSVITYNNKWFIIDEEFEEDPEEIFEYNSYSFEIPEQYYDEPTFILKINHNPFVYNDKKLREYIEFKRIINISDDINNIIDKKTYRSLKLLSKSKLNNKGFPHLSNIISSYSRVNGLGGYKSLKNKNRIK